MPEVGFVNVRTRDKDRLDKHAKPVGNRSDFITILLDEWESLPEQKREKKLVEHLFRRARTQL